MYIRIGGYTSRPSRCKQHASSNNPLKKFGSARTPLEHRSVQIELN